MKVVMLAVTVGGSLTTRPRPWEKGLVTLAKIPCMCQISVRSRGIKFVHTAFLTHEDDRLVSRPFKNGNKASRLLANLKFQKLRAYLHLLGY